MSTKNGDKSRTGRLRKRRNAKRLRDRALRAKLMPKLAAPTPEPVAV